ncbi:RrF2 family transcriptional regulator [Ghiorsea bivora]|uniref:RrF2 family transcriptional regulator n=1 Tax=Ghiorsea bivora TaxID=1485545 RepID=UPI00057024F9|nr:Rrf2 family transcriptional regulator [Ghiorsea bivora]
MQLTKYTDYSLRTLLYLGTHQDRLSTISEISKYHNISRNHLVKVVHQLGTNGYILTIRGKNGGIRLARKPNEIQLSQVVRLTEPNMDIQECFSKETNTCPLIDECKLKHVFYSARESFMKTLEEKYLSDIL